MQTSPSVTFSDLRIAALQRLMARCAAKGISFDSFYRDYVHQDGTQVHLNPFSNRRRSHYDSAELFASLAAHGYGHIPEFALNVVWQESGADECMAATQVERKITDCG